MRLLPSFLDFLFPRRCERCGKEGSFLCPPCLASLPPAATLPRPLEALFRYRDKAVRAILWKLKYRGVREIASLFGELMHERLLARLSEETEFGKPTERMLVPIPASDRRRGFNQAALLIEGILRHDREKVFRHAYGALTRVRETTPQMAIRNRQKRFENMRGAFAAAPERVKGASVILIDDVTTTGATFLEARRALLEAGAKDVSALAVAH